MDQTVGASRRGEVGPAGRQLRVWAAGIAVAAVVAAATTAAAVAVAPAAASPARGGASTVARAPVTARTACGVRETAAFKPARVVEGHNADLVVVLHNCTGAAHKVDLTEYGKVVCLVADPLVRQITLQAGQTKRVRTVYKAPPCTGSGSIVANLTSSEGKELATRTARFRIVAPPAAT